MAAETLERIVYPDEQLSQTTVTVFGIKFTVDAPNQLYNDLKDKEEVKEKSTNKKLDENATQEFMENNY